MLAERDWTTSASGWESHRQRHSEWLAPTPCFPRPLFRHPYSTSATMSVAARQPRTTPARESRWHSGQRALLPAA